MIALIINGCGLKREDTTIIKWDRSVILPGNKLGSMLVST
jgi:hypothetical protein